MLTRVQQISSLFLVIGTLAQSQVPIYERASCPSIPYNKTVVITYSDGRVDTTTQADNSLICNVIDKAACRVRDGGGVSYVPVSERVRVIVNNATNNTVWKAHMGSDGVIHNAIVSRYTPGSGLVLDDQTFFTLPLVSGAFTQTQVGTWGPQGGTPYYRYSATGAGAANVTWTAVNAGQCSDCRLSEPIFSPALFGFPAGAPSEYRISIPFQGGAGGGRNTNHRFFRTRILEPASPIVSRVKLELVHAGQIVALVDQAPDGIIVSVVGDEVTVRATIGAGQPTVGDPGLLGQTGLSYVLSVYTTGNCIALKEHAKLAPLWDARPLIGANVFGGQSAEGDKWSDPRTLTWLSTYQSRLENINDISGEHGNNIPHHSHLRGRDIDAFLYGYGRRGASLSEGEASVFQAAIEAHARGAAGGNATDIAWLGNWVASMRAGLTTLLSTPSVGSVLGPLGSRQNLGSGRQLPVGWADNLIRSGRLSVQCLGPLVCERSHE